MKFISCVASGLCASVVSAATFKAPIYSLPRDENASKYRRIDMSKGFDLKSRSNSPCAQQLLRPSSTVEGQNDQGFWADLHQLGEQESRTSHIWDWEEWVQITEITVGTPPQPFRVLLSISDSDIFLPSSHCDQSCLESRQYQSTLSSTYIANGTHLMGHYFRFSTEGIVSQDTVHIAGIELKNLTFGEAETFWRREPPELGDENWDGILGLGPSKHDRNGPYADRLDYPFLKMISNGLLDKNVFGLKLSRGLDDPGEITFGGINHDLYEGELKTLPLLNDSIELQRIQGRWKVPATSISIGDGSASLEGYAATLESDFPFIALPEDLVTLLENDLGMERKGGPYTPKSIDCSKRDELEEFTITLGEHDFVITPYEYTIELTMEDWGGHRCFSVFAGMPEMFDEKYVIIGSSFLKTFYGVFDLDDRTVSLGKLKEKDEAKSELKRK